MAQRDQEDAYPSRVNFPSHVVAMAQPDLEDAHLIRVDFPTPLVATTKCRLEGVRPDQMQFSGQVDVMAQRIREDSYSFSIKFPSHLVAIARHISEDPHLHNLEAIRQESFKEEVVEQSLTDIKPHQDVVATAPLTQETMEHAGSRQLVVRFPRHVVEMANRSREERRIRRQQQKQRIMLRFPARVVRMAAQS